MKELYNIAKNLKALRRQFHYTQAYVAKKLGIACTTYQSYEAGLAVPTLENYIKLTKLYDIYFEELFE